MTGASELRLRYQRSGGIAGMTLVADVLAGELPPQVRPVAASLLQRAVDTPDPGLVRDAFIHVVEAAAGHRRARHEWVEPHIPQDVRPLLKALAQLAEPQPRP